MVSGGGLSTSDFSAFPPLPQLLGGLRVFVGGAPAPLLNVTPTSVDFLVLPDTRQGDISLQMDSPPTFPI